ncbi:MAG: ABC transporter permease [Thalassobium sp.]|nr:MAG: ABC transporter permease [Thalassobium sp.]PIQ38996.1 MAG: ABC transporter permease [Thalassolituus sp. CG17_big_fil_post_rev_8_21_14_2_50_53_8]
MNLNNIFRLGIKELFSIKSDTVLIALIAYIFSFAIYSVATGVNFEVNNVSVAVADDDQSLLSRKITAALLPPQFRPAEVISSEQMTTALEQGRYVFILVFPPNFEKELLQGNRPELQLNIDATAVSQAGNGAVYIQQIIFNEVVEYLAPGMKWQDQMPVRINVRKLFNPNSSSLWFNAVMQLINSTTMLGLILTGAALIREREHGTIEHLLVMPVTPAEIMLAKIWSNTLVILVVTLLSLWLVVHHWLAVPVQGSVLLFAAGTLLYLFSVTALGIMLGTMTYTMAQFGLLIIPFIVVMNLLSGGTTPMESMPEVVQQLMQLSPSTHYVSFAQTVLYRGGNITMVSQPILILIASSVVFFLIALGRFRRTIEKVG